MVANKLSKLSKFVGWLNLSLVITLTSCAPSTATAPIPQANQPEGRAPDSPRVRKVGDVPQGKVAYRLQFISKQEGWLANGGHLWKTTNGGRDWDPLLLSDPNAEEIVVNIQDVQFLNSQTGWMLRLTGLFVTEDGGRTWSRRDVSQLQHQRGELQAINFTGSGKVGWAAGGLFVSTGGKVTEAPNNAISADSNAILEGAIFRTDDVGRTWQRQSTPRTTYRITDLYFLGEQRGLAVGQSSVFYTHNGGETWAEGNFKEECVNKRYLENYEYRPVAAALVGSDLAWLSFNDGRLAKSTDGGQTWCDLLSSENSWDRKTYGGFFSELYFTDALRGWGLKADGSLHETKNGGKTWGEVDVNAKFDDMFFLSDGSGWVVGKEGLFRVGGQ